VSVPEARFGGPPDVGPRDDAGGHGGLGPQRTPLLLADADLAACVGCGLCLPHCPTFRITGEESASPRGRIAAMRSVQWDGAPIDAEFAGFMDACVLCRGCEPACPSGVPFGRLMVGTREVLARPDDRTDAGGRIDAEGKGRAEAWVRRLRARAERVGLRTGLGVLGHPRLVRAGSLVLATGQRVGVVPSRRLGLPRRLPVRRVPLRATGTDVWLHTGCVMDAWQRPVHAATLAVLEAAGAGVALPDHRAGCCGALHEHAGLLDDARRLAERSMAAFAGDAPILVGSAGCGAALRTYGELLGTPEAEVFGARVRDVHEWLADRMDLLPPAVHPMPGPVAVQDPCHLRHVQRVHGAVRTVLAPYAEVVELDDEGLCCGAGGAYSVTHPEMAGALRARKAEAVARTGARVVASANPGCSLHLAGAGLPVRHPMEIVAEALGLTGG
jgi:glycolate oxidase iron-sulfur subunit